MKHLQEFWFEYSWEWQNFVGKLFLTCWSLLISDLNEKKILRSAFTMYISLRERKFFNYLLLWTVKKFAFVMFSFKF